MRSTSTSISAAEARRTPITDIARSACDSRHASLRWSRLERGDHRRWNARDGDVLGAIANRQPRDLAALGDREDRQLVAAGIGHEADASALVHLCPPRPVTDRDRGEK